MGQVSIKRTVNTTTLSFSCEKYYFSHEHSFGEKKKKRKDNLSIIAFSTWSQAEESKNQSTPL